MRSLAQALVVQLADKHLKGATPEDSRWKDGVSHFVLRLAYCRRVPGREHGAEQLSGCATRQKQVACMGVGHSWRGQGSNSHACPAGRRTCGGGSCSRRATCSGTASATRSPPARRAAAAVHPCMWSHARQNTCQQAVAGAPQHQGPARIMHTQCLLGGRSALATSRVAALWQA